MPRSRDCSHGREGHDTSVSPVRGLLLGMQDTETRVSLSRSLRTPVSLGACEKCEFLGPTPDPLNTDPELEPRKQVLRMLLKNPPL